MCVGECVGMVEGRDSLFRVATVNSQSSLDGTQEGYLKKQERLLSPKSASSPSHIHIRSRMHCPSASSGYLRVSASSRPKVKLPEPYPNKTTQSQRPSISIQYIRQAAASPNIADSNADDARLALTPVVAA
jgi:hypothetical protein